MRWPSSDRRGRQVHRSWWVAEGAIASVERNGGRPVLVLRNGLRVPVSKSFREQVKAAGWLDRPRSAIGILGAGAMATTHAAAYAEIAEATVVGVFSRDPTRARSAASSARPSRSATPTP